MALTLRPAEPGDAVALAPLMRAEDAAEVKASHGMGPLDALNASLATSERAWTLLSDGALAAMTGVQREGLIGWTNVWLLTGPAVAEHPFAYLRMCRKVVGQMLAEYDLLYCHVDARYHAALRFFGLVGFEARSIGPHGVAGLPFYLMLARRSSWVQ